MYYAFLNSEKKKLVCEYEFSVSSFFHFSSKKEQEFLLQETSLYTYVHMNKPQEQDVYLEINISDMP